MISRFMGVLVFLVLLAAACKQPGREVVPAFYHWQSRFQLSDPELDLMARSGVRRVYVRFFDVDWSVETGKVGPIAVLDAPGRLAEGTEMVPVVFITNRSLLHTGPAEVDTLRKHIVDLLFARLERFGWDDPREVQIDCDWNSQTRSKYFRLLDGIGEDLHRRNMLLSATIRLHQLKYRQKTGIPPADRGMLMYYNMGDLADANETNSILNMEKGRSYLVDYQRYPIPLDVALPIFAWGVVLREGKPVFLLNGLRENEAAAEPGLEKTGDNRFNVLESHYFRGEYLYRGDLIRTEAVSDSLLREAATLLAGTLQEDSLYVALYHLDSLTISHYELETFTAVWDAFR